MVIIKKSTNNKCGRGCGEKRTFLYRWWEYKLVQILWKTVWKFLRKLKIELPYDPPSTVLGRYPARSHHGRSRPWQGHVEEPWRARRIMAQGTPRICSSIHPKTKVCLSYYFVPFTNSSDINRGLSPTTFLWKKNQLRALVNGHDRSISIQTPLMAF